MRIYHRISEIFKENVTSWTPERMSAPFLILFFMISELKEAVQKCTIGLATAAIQEKALKVHEINLQKRLLTLENNDNEDVIKQEIEMYQAMQESVSHAVLGCEIQLNKLKDKLTQATEKQQILSKQPKEEQERYLDPYLDRFSIFSYKMITNSVNFDAWTNKIHNKSTN